MTLTLKLTDTLLQKFIHSFGMVLRANAKMASANDYDEQYNGGMPASNDGWFVMRSHISQDGERISLLVRFCLM